jgi:hypothetical protein
MANSLDYNLLNLFSSIVQAFAPLENGVNVDKKRF